MRAPTMLPGTEPIMMIKQKKLLSVTASASSSSGTKWLSVDDWGGYSPVGIAGFGLSLPDYFALISYSTDTSGKRVGANIRNMSTSQRTTDINFAVIMLRDDMLG